MLEIAFLSCWPVARALVGGTTEPIKVVTLAAAEADRGRVSRLDVLYNGERLPLIGHCWLPGVCACIHGLMFGPA